MADGTLHVNALTYPVISAQNNRKLKVDVTDILRIEWAATTYMVTASRASTSDPWLFEVTENKDKAIMAFSMGSKTIDSDNLNWKSMADLTIKQHLRTADKLSIALTGASNTTFAKPDGTAPCGYAALALADMQKVLTARADDAGNFSILFDRNQVANTILVGATAARGQLASIITHILGLTTQTSATAATTRLVPDLTEDVTATLTTEFAMTECQGTDAITVGNFTNGKMTLRMEAAAAGGYEYLRSGKLLDAGKALSVPSTQLDHLRRASNDGLTSKVAIQIGRNEDNLWVEPTLYQAALTTSGILVAVSILDPDAVIEFSFDQANSLNVLAAAAFAGIAGLSAVGAATELTNLLTNSPLSALFQQVAAALGSTTAAVIAGYVSALIAAYNNGWINNEQLFDLNQHYAWITAGAKYIVTAASVGIAAQGVGGLLAYMGVSSNVIATAITAVGGAATGAGVALGMSAIMAKVVRHRYWGE